LCARQQGAVAALPAAYTMPCCLPPVAEACKHTA
jgi:hypothetical protein